MPQITSEGMAEVSIPSNVFQSSLPMPAQVESETNRHEVYKAPPLTDGENEAESGLRVHGQPPQGCPAS